LTQITSIPNIISYAKIGEYLAQNDVTKSQIFFNGSLDTMLPIKIYESRVSLEWAYDLDYQIASATAVFYIDGTYDTGSRIKVSVIDPSLGLIVICTYLITVLDTTKEIVATNLALAINTNGYLAVSNGNAVIVTAPLALGSTINETNLIIEYLP